VARDLADIGLGTDTAGSGRVPAAANGIVGFKPTRGWISTAGIVPACASLDCVSVFARSVDEAHQAVLDMAGYDPEDPWSRTAVPVPSVDEPHIGGVDGPFDLEPFLLAGRLLYGGAFVAERYAAVGAFIESHRDEVDDVVAAIILGARDIPAWHLARDRTELEHLRQLTLPTWAAFDVIAVPTVPSLPTIAEVQADPIARNNDLGTYTTFANLLDLCALTIPIGEATVSHPPASITLLAPAWHDEVLVTAARRVLRDTPAILQTR
jgi:allophanate hydrolase